SADGSAKLGNGSAGVRCQDSPNFTFGGANAGDGCTICGSTQQGVFITGAGCTNTLVQHCYVGTDANGHAGFGNGNGGISLDTCTGASIRDCVSCGNQGVGSGIRLGTGCANATVDHCYLGLNPDGLTTNGNGTTGGSYGIEFNGATGCTMSDSYICGN